MHFFCTLFTGVKVLASNWGYFCQSPQVTLKQLMEKHGISPPSLSTLLSSSSFSKLTVFIQDNNGASSCRNDKQSGMSSPSPSCTHSSAFNSLSHVARSNSNQSHIFPLNLSPLSLSLTSPLPLPLLLVLPHPLS